jgi:hypothetical protein
MPARPISGDSGAGEAAWLGSGTIVGVGFGVAVDVFTTGVGFGVGVEVLMTSRSGSLRL